MLEADSEHYPGSRLSFNNMLGQLFSKGTSFLPLGGATAPSRPRASLESVQEDIHTRSLLFPDADTLYQRQNDQVFPLGPTGPLLTSSSSAFDLNPEVDLDLKDVRVVIMQEPTSIQNSAALLFDSHSPTEPTQSPVVGSAQARGAGSGRSITSPRRISLGQASKPVIITQENVPKTAGAFDRRPSAHARAASYVETEGQRSAREYREEMTIFSNCIFGSSDIMAYKGTGTKVHIIPTEIKASSYPFDGHGSLGRSSFKSSKLAQSYTSENITMTPSSRGLPGTTPGIKVVEKKKVLITRIFPVPLPNTDAEEVNLSTPIQQGTIGSSGYPFPKVEDGKAPGKKPKQKRTPMYAIGLILQLPATAQLSSAPASRSGFRPSSFTDHESYPSSYSSLKPSEWTVLGLESLDSSYSDMDDRIDAITQHWDIIMRTLSRLQAVVTENVLALLKQADVASPNLTKPNGNVPMKVPSASVSISGKRVETTFKPHKLAGTNAKLVQLQPHALAYHTQTKSEVDTARQRIVSGIKTQQVITRQGRWGIWREEARWTAKWAGGKEQAFFFYNLLTGFLGVHTEWLQALGPTAYRRHHYQQQRSSKDEDTPISARTIIVAQDKMAARRLLFLLSAFLSPNRQQQTPLTRMHRPGTATSYGGLAYSQSPPSFVPTILREESLRRKVNRRGRTGHSRAASITQPGYDINTRRDSDAMSLKTANLPIPGSDGGNGGTKKSSAVTTTTVTPATTIPHFSTRRPVRGTGPIPRPGSSGSLATDDLMRSLQRGDSSSHFSNSSNDQGYSRWGNMISTLWSNKRRGSTIETDITIPSVSDTANSPTKSLKKEKGKLAEMVEEAQRQGNGNENGINQKRIASVSYSIPGHELSKQSDMQSTPSAGPDQSRTEPELELTAAPPPFSPYLPPKSAVMGVDEDGCIDIDVPLPPFLSFGSPFSSPSSSGYLSGGGMGMGIGVGLESFEHYTAEESASTNVGGWLPRYHPDFVLQAIPAVPDHGKDSEREKDKSNLEAEIKESMRAEPTPPLAPWQKGEKSRWVVVSTALVADTRDWSIKRIRYRRHVTSSSPSSPVFKSAEGMESESLYGNPYDVNYHGKDDCGIMLGVKILEDEFVNDSCVAVDEGLVGAVERVVAWSSSPGLSPTESATGSTTGSGPRSHHDPMSISRKASRNTSRDRSRDSERQREGSDATAVPNQSSEPVQVVQPPSSDFSSKEARPVSLNLSLKVPSAPLEVPRGEVKNLLLGALEEVAREVAELREHEGDTEVVLVKQERDRESFLREGVRVWLEGVESW